jgi:hypothetical protein
MLRNSRLTLVLTAAAILAAGNLACKKTGSAPTGYGVNVTIDGTMLSSAQRASITAVSFTVVDDTQPTLAPFKHTLDYVKQLQGGKVTFQYVPADTVVNTDTLELGVDALAGTALVGSGASGKVPLKATAVEATIVLSGIGDGGITPGDGGGDGGDGSVGGKKTNGIACVTGDECNSTFCTDGVCCNEKCNDVCVSCNESPATKGTCTPYAVNTDPEMECLAVIPTAPPADDGGTTMAEAGTEGGSSPEAGSADASAASGDASADADNSDAVVINQPDGGFMTMPNACAGTCGGARACNYPGTTKTCGTAFCNSRRDVGTFVCDGNGGCAPTLASCTAYACDDSKGSCRTQCTAHVECLTDDYCSGSATCLPKKTNGITCTTGDECTSGACSGGVCCNTACDGQGLTCTEALHVGQCQCMGVTCAAGVACQVFYQDADGDTYGNATGTILAGTAKAGCMGAAPPTGFVADNTDCDDGDANAHPGQTAYFATASAGKHSFDYNCDGALQKQTPEYPGGSCKFCGSPGACSTTSTTCASANSGSFQCPQEGDYRVPIGPIEPIETTTATTTAALPTTAITSIATEDSSGLSSRATIQPLPILRSCCGCAASDKTGFLGTIVCGATGTTYTCTSCTAAGGGTSAGSPTAKVQSCH